MSAPGSSGSDRYKGSRAGLIRPIHRIQDVAAEVRQLLASQDAWRYRVLCDRYGDQIEQTDDYPIDWEIEVEPVNAAACSLWVIASAGDGGLSWGLFFDRHSRIASRL